MEPLNTETDHLFVLGSCIHGRPIWTLVSKERRCRPWKTSSDKTLLEVKSSSEEYCVSRTPISQSSEDKAGREKEVAEVTAGTPRSGSALKNHQLNHFFVNHFTAMESIHLNQKSFFCFLLWWTCAGGKIVLLFYIYFSGNHYKLQTFPSFLEVMLGTSLGQINFQSWWDRYGKCLLCLSGGLQIVWIRFVPNKR